MDDKYHQLYLENREFHDYIERLRRPGKNDAGRPLEEVLSGAIIRGIGDYYISRPNSENASPVSPPSPDSFCSCEDKSC